MQPGKNKSYTLGEAEAYDKGYKDGFQAARYIDTQARLSTVNKGAEACLNNNPDVRCNSCNCWKIFREYCS